jgi:hypothetical protein
MRREVQKKLQGLKPRSCCARFGTTESRALIQKLAWFAVGGDGLFGGAGTLGPGSSACGSKVGASRRSSFGTTESRALIQGLVLCRCGISGFRVTANFLSSLCLRQVQRREGFSPPNLRVADSTVRPGLRMMRCLPNEWPRYDPRLLRLCVKFRHPRSDGASRLTVCLAPMRPQRTRRSRLPKESSSHACPGAGVSHSAQRRSRVLHRRLLF